eukprot:gene3638-7253_t
MQDLDQVMSLHEHFLDSCLKECLLASQDLLRFSSASQVVSLTDSRTGRQSLETKRRVQTEYIRNETSHDSYRRMLDKFAEHFDTQLGEFLETLWSDSNRHHPQLSNLCVRLDYNGYYSEMMATEDR